jgi:hypothetical protein
MAQVKKTINSAQPIVEDDGTMSQLFRAWLLQVSNNIPIVNTGSPEGVIEAPQYSLYIDEAIPTVPVQYRKMLPEIGGDRSKGWVVV